MSSSKRPEPKLLSDLLGELIGKRGYFQLRASNELERTWNAAVGERNSSLTCVGQIRRGVLHVTVAHPALLEELESFHKPRLLATLRGCSVAASIRDIRFRVGRVEGAVGPQENGSG